MRIPLVGPSNTSYSLAAAASESLNCYLETVDTGSDGKTRYVLRGRPGIHLFKDLTTIDALASPVRGMLSGAGRLFVAAGAKEFEIDINGNLVGSVNTIATDVNTTPVALIPNANQLLIVASKTVYCDNGAGPVQIVLPTFNGFVNTFGLEVVWINGDQFDVAMIGQPITINGVGYTVATVTNNQLLHLTGTAGAQTFVSYSATPPFFAPTGAFMDGFYIANRPSSKQFNISALLDGSTWDPLGFGVKEGYPDNINAVWSEPPLLYLLGTETLEAWRDTGAADFPFERVDGGFARVGLAATWSTASIMGKLHMLAGGTYGQGVAVRMEGVTPVRISTHAVEESLNTLMQPGDGVAYSYIDRGHWFWVIHFKDGNAWVYDVTESGLQGSPQWHQRSQAVLTLPYTPRFHTFLPEWGITGMHIVGDYASGKLYEMSSDFFDDDGADIHCVRALPYVYNDGNWVFHHRFEVEMETGTAATPPVVTLDWSDDRGQTFGTEAGVNTVRTLGPGVTGVYTTRYFTQALGRSRGRVYRLKVVGQGRVAIIDAALEATMGTA